MDTRWRAAIEVSPHAWLKIILVRYQRRIVEVDLFADEHRPRPKHRLDFLAVRRLLGCRVDPSGQLDLALDVADLFADFGGVEEFLPRKQGHTILLSVLWAIQGFAQLGPRYMCFDCVLVVAAIQALAGVRKAKCRARMTKRRRIFML